MAFAKKCDICGALYETYNNTRDSKNPNGIQFLNIEDIGQIYGYRALDCCPECMESIKVHVDGLKKKRK